MRVLQVSKFYPPVMGGIEAVAWELTEGLRGLGLRTDVLCSDQRLRGRRDPEGPGGEVCRAGRWGMLLSTSIAPAMPWHLHRLAGRSDIVHLHMPDPMAAAAFWLTRPRTKLVVHWHSDVIRQRRALRLYEPLQNWLLGRADAIIATSPPYADASEPLQAWRNKVVVVPIGISDNRHAVRPEAVAAIRQAYRGRHLVFALGRMTYYKGYDVLIRAAAALPEDCAVVIGGDGELLDHYKAMSIRLGLAGKVHFLGHVPDDELPSYFEACDLFCMPSTVRAEAYGVAMLEAMVMARPVVASDIPGSGVPWVNRHGETGLNVPAGRPDELAAAIRLLLDSPGLRERMGQAARQRYERDFGADRMARATIDLYRRIVPAAPR